MGFYAERILPHVINATCSTGPVAKTRQHIVPKAQGDVLEVGMGSGLNLQYYDPTRVRKVYGVEPSIGMRNKAQANLASAPVPVEWIGSPGEDIELDDDSVDTVLLTYTLCTIADYSNALRQMRRVLRPDGTLLFCEHGLSSDAEVAKWQHRINSTWNRFSGGCHLNRPIRRLIEEAGFEIASCETSYLKNTPRIAGYTYLGSASGATR